MVPKDYLYVSESGIKNAEDIKRLYENGTDAVLIGETLMRSADKKNAIAALEVSDNAENKNMRYKKSSRY